MANYFGAIEILTPECDVTTLSDGRGAIFSWIPQESIKEFTLLYFHANKLRGNHYHPEFTEYFLVLSGSIALITVDTDSGKQISMLAGEGFCFKTPPHVPHLVQAITEAKCISLITKPWDECTHPIIYKDLVKISQD